MYASNLTVTIQIYQPVNLVLSLVKLSLNQFKQSLVHETKLNVFLNKLHALNLIKNFFKNLLYGEKLANNSKTFCYIYITTSCSQLMIAVYTFNIAQKLGHLLYFFSFHFLFGICAITKTNLYIVIFFCTNIYLSLHSLAEDWLSEWVNEWEMCKI